MAKEKRVNKTKAQIADEIKRTAEAERQRKILIEKVFPYLKSGGHDVGFTEVAVQVSVLATNQAFDRRKADVTVKDLKLDALVNETNPDAAYYQGLFKLLEDESVKSFNELLSNLPNYIDGYFKAENGKTKVADLDLEKIIG